MIKEGHSTVDFMIENCDAQILHSFEEDHGYGLIFGSLNENTSSDAKIEL